MREGLLAKYRDVDQKGKEAVLAGNITPYAFPVSLKNRFSLFALIEQNDFFKMFLEKVQKIESIFGFKLILAGRDVPPHFTVKEGNFDETKERLDFPKLISDFINDDNLTLAVTRILRGRIPIEQLLLDKGNLLLATPESPFFSIREKLSSFFQSIGLIPCPLDFTHSTISRIAEIPEGFSLNDWTIYHNYICGLQRFINRNDLVLRIKVVHIGEAYKFLTTKAG